MPMHSDNKRPIRSLLRHINHNLRRLDADFSVGAEVTVPATVSFGTLEHETELRFYVTEDGWDFLEPEQQAKRIERELFESLTPEGYTYERADD